MKTKEEIEAEIARLEAEVESYESSDEEEYNLMLGKIGALRWVLNEQ